MNYCYKVTYYFGGDGYERWRTSTLTWPKQKLGKREAVIEILRRWPLCNIQIQEIRRVAR